MNNFLKKINLTFFFSLFVIFTCLDFISCSCNQTQINVNTANLSELDKIINVGPVIAQRIIDSRPFSSLDDLIKVKGIGNVTLNEIKMQGLACVNEEDVQLNNSINESFNSSENISFNKEQEDAGLNASLEDNEASRKIDEENKSLSLLSVENGSLQQVNNSNIFYPEKIFLNNSKGIKTDKTKSLLEEVSFYGILLLGLILIILILNKKKKMKNELQ